MGGEEREVGGKWVRRGKVGDEREGGNERESGGGGRVGECGEGGVVRRGRWVSG